MLRKSTLGCAFLTSLSLLGCETALDQKQKAEQAREEAREEVIDAHARLDADVRRAEDKAARRIGEAETAFLEKRSAYQKRAEAGLKEIDVDIAKLEERAQVAKPEIEAELETLLATVKVKRQQFRDHVERLGQTAADRWDTSRDVVDAQWEELKKLLRSAS